MRFQGISVPGADWVEIENVRNKDGSPLSEHNWRRKLFGRISLCWVAGGFRLRGLYFQGDIRMPDGIPAEIDLDSSSWCSTTEAQPVEVESGVYELVTTTSIYRLRLLGETEKKVVWDAVEQELRRQMQLRFTAQPSSERFGMKS